MNYYIDLAGGPTKEGDMSDIIVIYANGQVNPKKRLFSPKIKEGSTIIVNQAEEKEKISTTEFVNNSLSIVSTLLTTILLSQQLNN